MEQMSLLPDIAGKGKTDLSRKSFSHQNVAAESARLDLERHYAFLLEETAQFNRKLVSFQASKDEILHSWLKYREGFSPRLVDTLLDQPQRKGNSSQQMGKFGRVALRESITIWRKPYKDDKSHGR